MGGLYRQRQSILWFQQVRATKENWLDIVIFFAIDSMNVLFIPEKFWKLIFLFYKNMG